MKNLSNTLSKWSLFLGIISPFTTFLLYIGVIVSISSITLAFLSTVQNEKNKMPKKSIVGLVIAILSLIFIFIGLNFYVYMINNPDEFKTIYNEINNSK